jgi:CheY-like chemotaxis protein
MTGQMRRARCLEPPFCSSPTKRSRVWTLLVSLRPAQFNVRQARNGDHAIGILSATHDIDIVISDVWMPGCTNGVALAAWLRIKRPDVRIVLMSEYLPPLAELAADLVVTKLPLLGRGS